MPFFRLGKRSQQYNVANKDLFVIPIELLTNEAIECTLFASSLGQECLANVCSKIGLANGEYFGLLFRNARRGVDQWVDLGRPLKKQLDKWAGGGEEPVRLLFRLQFFVPNFNFLADEITRYHYFCAMKGLVVEGRIGCSREDAILLASFSLQAEFGDYTPERHTVEYLNSFALFPMAMWAKASAATRDLLVECAIAAYRNLEGVPTAVAEIYYICEAQQREGGHGQEGFPARDLDTGQEVCLGVYIRGIFVVKMGGEGGGRKHNNHHHHHPQYHPHHREVEFFRWHDIANLMHNKKVFIVERSCPAPGNSPNEVLNSRKNYATLDPDFALAVWRCAVEQHQLFMKGHSFHSWQQANQSAPIQEQNLTSSGEGDYATHLLPHPPPQQMSNTSSPFPFLSNDFFLGYEHFLAQKNALAAQIAPTLAAATAAAASAAAAAAAASSITAAGMDSSSSLEPPNGGHYGNLQQYHLHHHHQQHHPDPRSSVSTGSLYETIKSSGSVSSGSKQPKTTMDVSGNGNGAITPSSPSSKVPTPKPRSSTEPIELHHIALQNCSSANPKISENGHHHLLHPPGPALTYTQKKLQSKTGTASAAVNNNSHLNSQISSTNGTNTISPKIMSSRNVPGAASAAAAATAAPIYENQQQLHSTDLTFEQRKKLLPPYRSPPDYGEFIKQRAAKAAAAASSGNSGVSGTTTMASLSQSMGSIPSRLASQFAGGGGGAGVSGGVVGASVSSSSLVGHSNGVGPRGGGGGVVQHSASVMSVPLALQQQQQQQKQLQQQLLYQQYQQYQTKAAGQQKQQQQQHQSNLKHANSAVAYGSKPNHLEVHPNHPYHHRGSLPPPELPPRTASLLNSPPPSSHHLSNSNLLYPSSPQSKVGGGMFTASSPELNNLHSLLHFQKQQNQNQNQQQQQNRSSTNQHVMQMVQQQQQNHQQYFHQNHHLNQNHHQLPNQNQFPPLQPNSTARPEVFASHKSRGDDGFDQLLLMSKHRPCFTSVPDLTFSNSSEQQQHQHGSFGSQTGLAKPDHHQQQQPQQQSNKQKLQSNGILSNGKVNNSSSSKGSFFAAFPLGKNPMRIFRSQHTTGSVPNLAASSAYQVQHQQQQQSNLQLHQQYNSRTGSSSNAAPKTRRSTEALNYWVGGFNVPSQSSNYHHHQQRSNSIAVLEQLPGRQQMPFSSYSISNRIDEAPELAAAAAAAAALAKPSNEDLQSSSTTTTTSPTPTTGTSSPSSSVPTGPPTNVYSLQGHQQQQQFQQNHQQNHQQIHQQNLQQQSQQQQQPKQQVIYANVGGTQQQQQHQQQESQQLPKTSHLHNLNHNHNHHQQQQQQITGVSDPRAAEAVANYISCVQSSSSALPSSAGVITSTTTISPHSTTTSSVITINNNNSNGITRPPSASRANPVPTSISSRIIVFNSENFHDQDFTREFELLPRMNPEAKFTTASLPENVLRNRFRDILPYEENR